MLLDRDPCPFSTFLLAFMQSEMKFSNTFEIIFIVGYRKHIRFVVIYNCVLMNVLLLHFLDSSNFMQAITVRELRKESETE